MTGADRELGDQSGRRSGDKILQHDVEVTDLDGEVQDSLRERAERVFGGMEWVLDVVAVRAEARAALDQRGGGALGDLFSQLSRCCDEQIAKLKLRTSAGTNRGVPADPQDADGFDNAGGGLRHDRCMAGESFHRRRLGIDRVVLAATGTQVRVGLVDLNNFNAASEKESGDAGRVRPRRLDPDLVDHTEAS